MNLLGMKPVDAWAEVKSIRWTAMEKYWLKYVLRKAVTI